MLLKSCEKLQNARDDNDSITSVNILSLSLSFPPFPAYESNKQTCLSDPAFANKGTCVSGEQLAPLLGRKKFFGAGFPGRASFPLIFLQGWLRERNIMRGQLGRGSHAELG